MPLFCDVALAVPLDMVFTYAIPLGMDPVVGGRVLVPFRQQRMSGIVVELHDRPPQVLSSQITTSQVKLKKVIEALDLSIAHIEQEIAEGLHPFEEQLKRLEAITGVSRRILEVLFAEVGWDMSRFPDAAHLASWAGMCPG